MIPIDCVNETNALSLLQAIIKSNKINLDDVLDEMEKMKNQKIITNHINSFSTIWQGKGKDSRWKTYLPSVTGKSGRKLIACSTRANLENRILAYYKQTQSSLTCFHTLYLEWLNLKRLEVSNATIERIHSAYNRFYKDKPIDSQSVTSISYLYLKEFLLSTVKEYNMNYKQYCNFSCVLRGVLDYSVDKELLSQNPFDKFKIGKNTLRSPDNKVSISEVFTIEERQRIEKAIGEDYQLHKDSTAPLALLLDFYTGLRSGELVALTWSDIQGDILHVHRTETSYTVINEDGTKGDVVYEIKDSPKSDAGFRDIELIPKAIAVLAEIKRFNERHHWNSEYIFLDNNERICRKRLDKTIRKYCRKLDIQPRSMHKIRKYYISALKASDVEDDEIRRLAGHKDLTTTFNSYCFSVLSHEETKKRLISAL